MSTDLRVSQSEFAVMQGWDKSHVTRLKKGGRLVIDDRGLVIVEASVRRILETADPAKAGTAVRHAAARAAKTAQDRADDGRPAADTSAQQNAQQAPDTQAEGASADVILRQAAIWNERKEAVDLAMRLRKNNAECGLLTPVDEVRAAVADAMTVLCSGLDAMGSNLCVVLGAAKDEGARRVMIDEYVERLRADLAARFSALGRAGAEQAEREAEREAA